MLMIAVIVVPVPVVPVVPTFLSGGAHPAPPSITVAVAETEIGARNYNLYCVLYVGSGLRCSIAARAGIVAQRDVPAGRPAPPRPPVHV